MATEEGVVIRTAEQTAWVKTIRSAACEACASRSSCTAMGGGNEMEVEVVNLVGAGVGDRVLLHFETSSLLKATFMLYVLPILMMLIGAVIGNEAAAALGWNASAASAIFGFFAFFVVVFFVRRRANRMARQTSYQPTLSRILQRGVTGDG